ncbi:hypothetical protein HNQ91_003425 [Filimonas zeae]|uniref:Toxin SymE-like domain-containing protein n=1 Tax=Filimonas zeae TaxID=1737353 RepID=A0A917IZV5_9BACT|nr:SymE family type I addiction module toxin [Filimonas zeae]MDR6340360.1 hypothetical protein [Filimonas zeae]GGH72374.1 hypothetical protein GCM10011379_32720 [Filimonas zeae]
MRPQRQLKVAYKFKPVNYGCSHRQVPFINLSGNWLQNAGFKVGETIVVVVEHERLVIKKAPLADDIKMRG